MGLSARGLLGITLGRSEGYPHLSQAALAYTFRRAALTAVAIAAFIAGISASAAAAEGVADAGVIAGNPGGVVTEVSPTGFAWRDGIRPGQRVVALDDTYSPSGWRIEAADSFGSYTSRELPFDDALRGSLPFGLAAVLAGALAVVFVRTHRRWVLAFAAIAVATASVPLQIQGNPWISTASLGAAALIPLAWVAGRLDRATYQAACLAPALLFICLWAGSRLSGDSGIEILEPVRADIANYGTAVMAMVLLVGPLLRGERIRLMRPALSDLILVASIGAIATGLLLALHVSPFVLIVGLPAIVVAMPGVRRVLARRLENALLADVREQVAMEASEAERARLARELHDVPLQHLSSVIRHLEAKPDSTEETRQLREIAAQLRETATGLRPPVLDDLGLVAALEFLATEATSPELIVTTHVIDQLTAGSRERPPAEVEMGVFRVAEEAVNNAIRHSAARTVAIEGEVKADAINIVVRDDGLGLSAGREREAARAGRLGLPSMRRRAEAIDADLTIDRSGPGTSVALRWQR